MNAGAVSALRLELERIQQDLDCLKASVLSWKDAIEHPVMCQECKEPMRRLRIKPLPSGETLGLTPQL
jgi:hypothetical protein